MIKMHVFNGGHFLSLATILEWTEFQSTAGNEVTFCFLRSAIKENVNFWYLSLKWVKLEELSDKMSGWYVDKLWEGSLGRLERNWLLVIVQWHMSVSGQQYSIPGNRQVTVTSGYKVPRNISTYQFFSVTLPFCVKSPQNICLTKDYILAFFHLFLFLFVTHV